MEKIKKLYLISQDVENGYDTYESAVVVSTSIGMARRVEVGTPNDDWAMPKDVKVKYLGIASSHLRNNSIVCASFNAG